eukprot:gnl/Dysnectes_brevis/2876_a3514_1282.p1 GENE.gnl/Dysnectes_brevis/2876_a3514_1282~~gnl/Dysnectes_brevis/2876_a3514_1282.p1  ORF type:complete len:578 (+),score=181.43 gnl/Dysnectes_brevis/2876_a3514_1282:686-2419(+)
MQSSSFHMDFSPAITPLSRSVGPSLSVLPETTAKLRSHRSGLAAAHRSLGGKLIEMPDPMILKDISSVPINNAKIISTIGPASRDKEVIRRLFEAGCDLFRLNFSHGTHAEHQEVYDRIREVEEEVGVCIGIIGDLQGPKLRVGTFEDGPIDLVEGESFQLHLDNRPGSQTHVSMPHPEIFEAVDVDDILLLNDGYVRLKVTAVDSEAKIIDTVVALAGQLSNRKGVSVPSELNISAVTEKDRKDLQFACNLGVDYIALSFVQTAADVVLAKELIRGRAKLISKIEKPSAVENLPAIVNLSDAIMVARGDLGIETQLGRVPALQKYITRVARAAGRPVIVATQMLETLISNRVPTRAEASDVATALYDGADACMLSAETAVGVDPVNAVASMTDIITMTESDPTGTYQRHIHNMVAVNIDTRTQTSDAVALGAVSLAQAISAKTIVVFSQSGRSCLRLARNRPDRPILCLTTSKRSARWMSLVWGVNARMCPHLTSTSDMRRAVITIIAATDLAQPGDHVVVVYGTPFLPPTPGKRKRRGCNTVTVLQMPGTTPMVGLKEYQPLPSEQMIHGPVGLL